MMACLTSYGAGLTLFISCFLFAWTGAISTNYTGVCPNYMRYFAGENTCIWHTPEVTDAASALKLCQKRRGNLLKIEAAEKHLFINDMIRALKLTKSILTIGLRMTNEQFLWWDNTTLIKGRYFPPDWKLDVNATCVAYKGDGLWHQTSCNMPMRGLCEIEDADTCLLINECNPSSEYCHTHGLVVKCSCRYKYHRPTNESACVLQEKTICFTESSFILIIIAVVAENLVLMFVMYLCVATGDSKVSHILFGTGKFTFQVNEEKKQEMLADKLRKEKELEILGFGKVDKSQNGPKIFGSDVDTVKQLSWSPKVNK